MNTIEKINYPNSKDNIWEKLVNKHAEKTKDKVNITISTSLEKLFWLKKEQIASNTKKETTELSIENEINYTEATLAKIFWKTKEMFELSYAQEKKEPLSMAHVMQSYDVYQLVL